MRWNRCLPALALLIFLPVRADEGAASAQQKEPAAKKAPTAAANPAARSSLTVARDPVTGALRPLTAEEARQLIGRQPLVARDPQVVTLPDGTRMMRLGPEHASLSVARKNPDGTLTSECVHGTAEARAFLEAAPGPVPAPATRER